MKYRSQCPVASALDVFGDKWALIVLRTIFAGRRRYGDLLKIPERISTNMLADRLATLEREGLISSQAHQRHPPRYEHRLTKKGAELLPMATWSKTHIPDRWDIPPWFANGRAEQFHPQ